MLQTLETWLYLHKYQQCKTCAEHVKLSFHLLGTNRPRKVPSPREPLPEPSREPSCEEKGSSEGLCKPSSAYKASCEPSSLYEGSCAFR